MKIDIFGVVDRRQENHWSYILLYISYHLNIFDSSVGGCMWKYKQTRCVIQNFYYLLAFFNSFFGYYHFLSAIDKINWDENCKPISPFDPKVIYSTQSTSLSFGFTNYPYYMSILISGFYNILIP